MNWYKQSEQDLWPPIPWAKNNGREMLHQCFWCGGFILPNGNVIYPPLFDKLQYAEGEQIRDEVEKYISLDIKKQTISHGVCDICKPYFIKWRDNI